MTGFSLDDLDDAQREAALAPRGPVCIVAGAGTGKTRTITYRIAHLVDAGLVNPQRVLAVTFTTRAAGELRDRLARMGVGGVQARTFHGAALRQLRYFWPQVAGDQPVGILDSKKFGHVLRAATAVGVDATKETVRDLLGEIEWAKACLISPDSYADQADSFQRTPPVSAEQTAAVYARYEESKRTAAGLLLDFDDIIIYTASMLENYPGIADVFREQYRTFVIDEYQDVTPLQQRLVTAWLGERRDLTVVGDANQTIYSFTGASPRFLLEFSSTYPEAVVVRLERDYRSTPQVTDLANAVISQATGRIAGTRLTLRGMQPSGEEPRFVKFDSEPAGARAIAAEISALIARGVPASEIAILYRMNSQSAVFEQALAERGIVYQVKNGEGFFSRPEVKQALGALVATANRPDAPSLRETSGQSLLDLVRAGLARLGLTEQEPEGMQSRERWQMLTALWDLINDIVTARPEITLVGLNADLHARMEAKQSPRTEGVTLASLHAAKGLEWDAVFLTGLEEKTLPIRYAVEAGEQQIEEERRLFYVGITRARRYLHISWAAARAEGGHGSRKRSRFLDGIVEEDAPPTAARPKRRRKARSSGDVDDGLFAALRAWRLEQARAENIPAYMVFTDATLVAIAQAMPRTEAEFLAVPGVGPVKFDRYGKGLAEVLTSFSCAGR
ncbi:MAG: ATP-dependent DNA helicase UvrD2 [Corynebacterium sp.]|nr:ATP-dependent DNA helicase UvrD2 [Corynebacterium sp.]